MDADGLCICGAIKMSAKVESSVRGVSLNSDQAIIVSPIIRKNKPVQRCSLHLRLSNNRLKRNQPFDYVDIIGPNNEIRSALCR